RDPLIRFARSAPLALLALLLAAPPPAAEVKPGEVITSASADRVAELVSPGVLWLVRNGMTMEIVPHRETEDPPAFRAATEKYSAQVRLRPDGVLNESTYVAGKPFPDVDPDDPQAALKIMYNFERSRYATDDLTARFLDAETGEIGRGKDGATFRVERHFVIDALRLLKYVGRTETPPVPALPNPERFLVKVGQYPILEPFDLKGIGGLVYRYVDDTKPEVTWMYMPSLRRVKRISTAHRSDALYGQDVDIDSYGGFAGHVRNFEWKLLGVKPMLASGHGENLPPKVCEGDGGLTFCETWEILPQVFIIEGEPKAAAYAYSKRVLFLEGRTSYIAYTDLYDQAGELWKVGVNYGRYARKPNPRAAYEYPFPRGYHHGFVMVDIQLSHGTRAALPGIGFPEEPGWYINTGDTSEEWFDIASLIKGGR
ncbi:MAG: DUF1329 domain-containing protein, partial [Candidatus Binatia bacterium]